MSVPPREQRLLTQKSGNICAFPGCHKLLTSTEGDVVVLGQIAHIVASKDDGPRGDANYPDGERNSYSNLILLCNIHHQLVDSKPATYTVQALRAMKERHESWVESRLTLGTNGRIPEGLSLETETIYSSALPVTRLPRFVYGVACDARTPAQVAERLRRVAQGEMAPFILKSGMLLTFQNLNDQEGPFADWVPGQSAERFDANEWLSDTDKSGWYIDLLNRALNKLTGRRGLMLDGDHHRYYFRPPQAETELTIKYRPLNKRQASRSVVWQVRRRSTGEARGYWYHRAVSLRFLRLTSRDWALSIRPELHVTRDGIQPIASDKIGARVTKKKSRRFNYDLLSEVNFWRDFLSQSKPRIVLSFGAQEVVISTNLLQGTVAWPGIPQEYAKPFANVEYLDDLFTWGEIHEIESRTDLDEEDWDVDED